MSYTHNSHYKLANLDKIFYFKQIMRDFINQIRSSRF